MELLNIKGIGDKTLEKLNSLGIYSVMDILNFLPKSYLDFTNVSKLEDIAEEIGRASCRERVCWSV